MARAMWKASLELGNLSVPVKLYAAVQEQNLHFCLLHAKDRVPVKQQLVDPRSGEEVPADEVRRGVELESEGLGTQVSVAAVDGVVTLSGRVPAASDRSRAKQASRDVAGVHDVQNRLDVGPIPPVAAPPPPTIPSDDPPDALTPPGAAHPDDE